MSNRTCPSSLAGFWELAHQTGLPCLALMQGRSSVFKCVCVCRPDIDVGSLPDHCLLYLLRQGLPLNAESLDSASLAKLDCLASVSHKQGLQGGFLLRFQGSRCSPHTCSKYLLPHSLYLVPQAELSALFKRLKG